MEGDEERRWWRAKEERVIGDTRGGMYEGVGWNGKRGRKWEDIKVEWVWEGEWWASRKGGGTHGGGGGNMKRGWERRCRRDRGKRGMWQDMEVRRGKGMMGRGGEWWEWRKGGKFHRRVRRGDYKRGNVDGHGRKIARGDKRGIYVILGEVGWEGKGGRRWKKVRDIWGGVGGLWEWRIGRRIQGGGWFKMKGKVERKRWGKGVVEGKSRFGGLREGEDEV
jgi:hypothetical protein